MIKVTVNEAIPTPEGVLLGLTVEHARAGWVRFTTTMLFTHELSPEEWGELAFYARTEPNPDDYEDTPLFHLETPRDGSQDDPY